eukprot:12923919-Alexandrium_andersonii.AAC.1
MCALSADVFKAFDQVSRPLVLALALRAGCPRALILPWFRFMQSLRYYNDYGNFAGDLDQKRVGIPQGCPLSMMLLSLVLRPVVVRLTALNATPRLLADDILVVTEGRKAWRALKVAGEALFSYLTEVGAR